MMLTPKQTELIAHMRNGATLTIKEGQRRSTYLLKGKDGGKLPVSGKTVLSLLSLLNSPLSDVFTGREKDGTVEVYRVDLKQSWK